MSEQTTDPRLAQFAHLGCDVCNRDGVIGVASSSLGAISFAFCAECCAKPAEPRFMFEYLFDDVSDNGEGLAEHVNDFWTWIDGRYVGWPEFRDMRRAQSSSAPAHYGQAPTAQVIGDSLCGKAEK